MTALSGTTIIETAERVCGEWTARLLADFGAEVIKVERPGGSPTRCFGPPLANGASAVFAYANTGKKSVVLDLETPEGRAALERLLARADALIDDHTPAWCARRALGPEDLTARFPRLVHCHITPFGQDAPADMARAFPINIAAAGGWAWHTPSESDDRDPPLMGASPFMPDFDTGYDAALATAASLFHQRRTGEGQAIDLSEVAVQLSRADVVLGRVLAGDDEPSHSRRRYDMGGPGRVFACADGHVHLIMTTARHWRGLLGLMGDPAWGQEFPEDWLEFHCTPDRVATFREHFRSWVADKPRDVITHEAHRRGVMLAPVNLAPDLFANPQYRHRGFFQALEGIDTPAAPYRMTASPARLTRPAPEPGADDREIAA
ncbi:CaiB/BaiF CoA transferase family protein [Novosphingobium profundi]|uniref:CaiB/BaiF CoA transferase family protein n=1 Tax=Novosphingobium profundi TaxID=1774954 RepID=UPI001CFD6F14|nr:CoA transferase [Novosphingobium profundi]